MVKKLESKVTTFEFKGEVLTPHFCTYTDGSVAIQLFDEHGDTYMVATVNIAEHMGMVLPSNMVTIKDYSENEGIFEALSKAGLVSPLRTIYLPPGKSKVEVCILLTTQEEKT